MRTGGRPAVSICVPTYNGAKYLREAVESALSQSFSDFELLLVDDASTDHTSAIAKDYARRDKRVRLYQNPRRLGIGGNWNRCLELAAGEWVKFLFQDDRLSPTCVSEMHKLGAARGATLVACGRHFVFEEDVQTSFKEQFLRYVSENNALARFPRAGAGINKAEFAAYVAQHPMGNCVGEPTSVMFKRSACGVFGNFNTDLRQLLDWEYWIGVGANEGWCYLDQELATFRLHGKAATMSNQPERGHGVVALDALVIRHEIVYNPLYEAVREAGQSLRPGVDPKQGHFAQHKSTRVVVREIIEKHGLQNTQAAEVLERTIKKYGVKAAAHELPQLYFAYYSKRLLNKLSRWR